MVLSNDCVDRLVDGSLNAVKDLFSSDSADMADTSVCDTSLSSSVHVSSSTSAAASSSSSDKTNAGEFSLRAKAATAFSAS